MLHDEIDRKKGYAAAVLFSALVGFSFLGIKICQQYTDGLNILCYRYDFAMLAVLLLMAAGKVKPAELRRKPKGKLLLTAAFYVGFMAFQVAGLFYATSVEGSIIFAVVPIMVKIIASLFLKERTSWAGNAFICMTVASLIFMIVMGASGIEVDPLGTALLLIASVMMAMSNIFMRYTRNDYRPIEITTAIVILGFVVFNAAAVVRAAVTGTGVAGYFEPLLIPQVAISAAYLGIGCILLSAHLMSYMLSRMEAAKGTIFGNLSTAISIVAGVAVLGEPLMWYHVVCTAAIVAGVIGMSLSGEPRDRHGKEKR